MAQKTWRERLAGQDNPSGPLHPEDSRVRKRMGRGNQNVLSKRMSEFTESGGPRTPGEGCVWKSTMTKPSCFYPEAPVAPGGIAIMITPMEPLRHCQIRVSSPPRERPPISHTAPGVHCDGPKSDSSWELIEEDGYTHKSFTSSALHGALYRPYSEEETRSELPTELTPGGVAEPGLPPKPVFVAPGSTLPYRTHPCGPG